MSVPPRTEPSRTQTQAPAPLSEREALLAEAQAIAGVGSWAWDVPGNRIVWSDVQFRLHGREPVAEVTYEWFFSHVHPDDQPWLAEWMERVLVSGDSFEFPYRIVRPDGEVRWLYARGRMEMSPAGEPLRMVGTSQDITERKSAEDARRAADESYRTIFDSSNDAIFVHDLATGAVIDANRVAVAMSGVTREELLSRGMEIIGSGVPPFTRERAQEQIARAAAGEPQRFEWCTVHPQTGEERWVEVGLQRVTIRGEDRLLALVRDIAERKKAERALVASEEAYRTIFQHSSEAIWVHDVETGAVLEVNQAACDLYGYTHEEMMRLPHEALLYPGSEYTAERVGAYLARAIAGETPRFEWMGRHRDGSEVWGEVTLRRVTVSGSDRILATVRDIKDRKQAEQALRRANEVLEQHVAERTAELAQTNMALEEEIAEHEAAREQLLEATAAAERANQAKSEFLSRMSHELRTPMNSILGFAQVLEGFELPERQERCVQHILKAGRHLLQLINEVLEISRIEAGRHNLSLEPVRVGPVLQEALALARPMAAQARVTLEYAAFEHDDMYVRADRQRLAQVLLNLLSNAVKYNRAGGRVRLSCAPAPARAGDEPPRLSIRIEDTGPGIAPDRQAELFTPFARLGAERSDVEGTGLGLALSQRLSEAMGGDLVLERTSGEGSVFRVDLQLTQSPLVSADETVGDQAPAPARAFAPARLLYVEDNLANLSLVETILWARPQWRTIPALQGQIGVELAREHLPDLVLLDLHLPDISGEEVLRRLRADVRTAHIPVVVISADATQAAAQRLLSAGAAAFLTKPLGVAEFLETLEHLLPAEATDAR